MGILFSHPQAERLVRRAPFRLAASIAAGLFAFLLAYALLNALLGEQPVESPEASTNSASGGNTSESTSGSLSLAARLPAGSVAFALPTGTQDSLFGSARVGDRLDVIAPVPGQDSAPATAAVMVRGATFLGRSTGPGNVILVQVSPEEGVVLGHLVQSGTRLTYALWSATGAPAPPAQP